VKKKMRNGKKEESYCNASQDGTGRVGMGLRGKGEEKNQSQARESKRGRKKKLSLGEYFGKSREGGHVIKEKKGDTRGEKKEVQSASKKQEGEHGALQKKREGRRRCILGSKK